MRKRVWIAWSSGKDSAWSLHVLRTMPEVEVVGLFTTVHVGTRRVAVHSVREELLDAQARELGLPLRRIDIPHPCPNEVYSAAMEELAEAAAGQDVTHLAFGDLFLEDIRAYREQILKSSGLGLMFPIWGLSTRLLAEQMTASGLRAYITCIDPERVPRSWVGREFNPEFVAQIPDDIDPCGERGEFHTFVFDGPMFNRRLQVRCGEITDRDGFVYADLCCAGPVGGEQVR